MDSLLFRTAVLFLIIGIPAACDGNGTGPSETPPVASVEVAPDTETLEEGESITLVATPKDQNGNALPGGVTWSTSRPHVASVSAYGRVTGVEKGTATVTATSGGVGGTATIRVIEVGAYDCSDQSQIPQAECWALVALFESTNGPEWLDSSGWLTNPDPCSWYGVTCPPGNVSQLVLPDNNLRGPIPPELGVLTDLEWWSLRNNQLEGPIPAELGDLVSLRSWFLSGNVLTGPVPLSVAQLGGRIQNIPGHPNYCQFTPPGNDGLTMPDTQDFRDADLDADGLICGLGFEPR